MNPRIFSPRWMAFFVLLPSLFLPLFVSAQSDAPTGEIVTVKVFALPKPDSGNPEDIANFEVLQRFRELHPDILLVTSSVLQIEGRGSDSSTLMSIAGRSSPDILSVNFRQSDTFIRRGFLYPLDEYVEQFSKTELSERIPNSVLPVMYREGPDGKSHYWLMPTQPTAVVMLYRKDLFAAAGLDPEHGPKDWNELVEFAKKITNPKEGVYALSFAMGNSAAWTMFSYFSSAGAKAVEQLPNGEWRACFDSEESVTAYEFVNKLMRTTVTKDGVTGPIALRDKDPDKKWQMGKLAMRFTYLGSNRGGTENPDLMGYCTVPLGPGGKSSSEINCPMYGIFAGQKNKRVRDAAWKYIHFLGSEEARRIFTRVMVEQGAFMALRPLWLEKYGFPQLAKLCPPGIEQAYQQAIANGTPEPYGKNCQFIYAYMSRPMERLYLDKNYDTMSPQQWRTHVKETLVKIVEDANEHMVGTIPEDVRRKRNLVAWFVAGGIVIGFILLLRLVFGWMNVGRPPSTQEPSSDYKTRFALLLIAPAFLLILTWHYYPLLRGSLMGFQDYNIMGGSTWVGIDNFADVIFSERFWFSLRNAAYFCALWMTMGFLPPVLLAVMLQEIPRGKILFRILFYLPAVVSGVVILFMWKMIYEPSPAGILNKILAFLHLPAQTWLQDPRIAMICVVFPLAWAHLGPGCIIYLAALKGIPDELYEAADIDGASFFNKLNYIVIPYMKPLLVINGVGAIIHGFNSGGTVLAMTGGGPDYATHVVGYEIFETTFLFLKFGQGTAMAWILGLLLLSFTAVQLRILNKVEFRTAGR